MLFAADMTVEGIQIETDSEDQARSNALEDAGSFYGDWTYGLDSIAPAQEGDEPTEGADDMGFEVDLVDEDEGLYTFDATCRVVFDAPDEDSARELAVQVPRKLRYDPPATTPAAP